MPFSHAPHREETRPRCLLPTAEELTADLVLVIRLHLYSHRRPDSSGLLRAINHTMVGLQALRAILPAYQEKEP